MDRRGSAEHKAIALLKRLIATQSFSREEEGTALLIEEALEATNVTFQRKGNNVWCYNKYFDKSKETILLNSHHDTVKPNAGYTRDPFTPEIIDDKLYGLGSNDAGGCLVSLMQVFLHFHDRQDLPYNVVYAATAEEEISGRGGVESILPELPEISLGIVGEPTEMAMAVSEKGLMVLDCIVTGKAGHAARSTGINAIYEAIQDIDWVQNYEFPKVSEHLGPIKMTVTVINAGSQHNVIPDQCSYVIDVRPTDAYTNAETLEIIKSHLKAEVKERSMRLNPSAIERDHIALRAAGELGIHQFGSPTTSDQAVMPFPTVKMGPGRSERSHTPDEFIYVHEIGEGIDGYIRLIEKIFELAKAPVL
ncbi:MAG: M20 family metallo-hydrolase [Bacteroidota bacterium]